MSALRAVGIHHPPSRSVAAAAAVLGEGRTWLISASFLFSTTNTSLRCSRSSTLSDHHLFLSPHLDTASSTTTSVSSCYAYARVLDHHHHHHPIRTGQRRNLIKTWASNWDSPNSPYETLELERDADEEKIKAAYRRLAKYYHPDVYDGRGTLEEGETAEARFIKIQAAYELLIDNEKRREYDYEHRVNPMKASQAWMEWLMKKRKAFDQRGDMAIAAWAEQQQREMYLRARNLSRSKIDPEEERRILAKEKKASMENFTNTLKRHTLVLKKRDIMRRKAEGDRKKVISQLLAAEGLELDSSNDDDEV